MPSDTGRMTPAEPSPGEVLAAKYRHSDCRDPDSKPEGTAETLLRCANMLDTYGPDCFPANELGQIHFARAMMESTADEIRAYFRSLPPPPPADAEAVRLETAARPDTTGG